MKTIAEIDRLSYERTGDVLLTLRIAQGDGKRQAEELPADAPLAVDICPVKSRRSLEQNKFMWALIAEIDRARNGGRAADEWAVYVEALERAGAKFEYIACLTTAEEMLKKAFRAVKYVKPFEGGKGEMGVYKCFYGSSKMNTKEMGELIETILDMAAEEGINTAYWEGVLT